MRSADIFQRVVEHNKLSHAYVFSGNSKEQKMQAVSYLLAKRAIQSADKTVIKSEGKEITIAEIRAFGTFFSMSSWASPYKVGVIEDAHLMNREAQSAFLKLLEEPKGSTVLLLITEFPDMLFDTIRSRCQEFPFYTFETAALPIESVEKCKRLQRESLHGRFVFAKKLADTPESISETMQQWIAVLRASMLEQAKSDKGVAYALAQKIKTAQEILLLLKTTNVNPRLAFERFMLDI